MPTEAEELQAKEFLKRAEIRTMKKDLLSLREVDSLKERDKIAKIRTLEEQRADQEKKLQEKEAGKAAAEKAGMEEILGKNEGQERIAEKDLKDYATEEERQQIFLLESQRLALEKQIDVIDNEKDPALKLEKNKILLERRDVQAKLDSIIVDEQKLEGEQKVIIEKEQTTTVPAEKKGLEQARWDLDKKIQDIEKKRWEVEKQIEDADNKVIQIDKSSEQLVTEKNTLRDKVLGADKSLRDIYSNVMAREEEKRRGQAEGQIAKREALSKARLDEKEKVQREQRSGVVKDSGYLVGAPAPVREKILRMAEAEEEQRKKFLQDVENWSESKDRSGPMGTPAAPQPMAAPPTPPTRSAPPPPPMAPMPPKK